MAEHVWSVLCEKTLIDPESKVISLFEVSESIVYFDEEGLEQQIENARRSGKKGVFVNSQMQLVSWWFRSDPKEPALQVRFTLRTPVKEVVFTQVIALEWAQDANSQRITLRIDRVPVTMLGLHWFIVEQQKVSKRKTPRWVTVTKIPLSIDKP